MKLKGVIFDVDGTLIDSMSIWDDIVVNLLEKRGIVPTEEFLKSVRPLAAFQSATLVREKFKLSVTNEEVFHELNTMAESYYINHIKLKPHAKELLEGFKKAGVKICIATANERYLVEAALNRLDVAEYFEFIITSTDVGAGKEEPTIFLKALELLNTKIEETIIFEDSDLAIKTAKKIGFKVVGVYDEAFADKAEVIKETADSYITSFENWHVGLS